ncbi:hypothetical protein NEOLI_000749 [Neolecta irregularis DAH-3]|uniref:Uncharacterized protein n=1 Tax=Neolecta irregularis (strain DAH-3) TaxID=1198029 RepID=A0A1U7LWF7_NEOID|nr:hypothetical protein NEOLI_000749 [Neolecta irregularis DAH-3]|eukprot:OLL26958.1 hypothetical protein NEOLI_000749 [Neolecta irregularis DAH-3]
MQIVPYGPRESTPIVEIYNEPPPHERIRQHGAYEHSRKRSFNPRSVVIRPNSRSQTDRNVLSPLIQILYTIPLFRSVVLSLNLVSELEDRVKLLLEEDELDQADDRTHATQELVLEWVLAALQYTFASLELGNRAYVSGEPIQKAFSLFSMTQNAPCGGGDSTIINFSSFWDQLMRTSIDSSWFSASPRYFKGISVAQIELLDNIKGSLFSTLVTLPNNPTYAYFDISVRSISDASTTLYDYLDNIVGSKIREGVYPVSFAPILIIVFHSAGIGTGVSLPAEIDLGRYSKEMSKVMVERLKKADSVQARIPECQADIDKLSWFKTYSIAELLAASQAFFKSHPHCHESDENPLPEDGAPILDLTTKIENLQLQVYNKLAELKDKKKGFESEIENLTDLSTLQSEKEYRPNKYHLSGFLKTPSDAYFDNDGRWWHTAFSSNFGYTSEAVSFENSVKLAKDDGEIIAIFASNVACEKESSNIASSLRLKELILAENAKFDEEITQNGVVKDQNQTQNDEHAISGPIEDNAEPGSV